MIPVEIYACIGIVLLAMGAEYIDSTIGMGFGTLLTPLLLILGYSPEVIVPAILCSEIFTGLLAGVLHHLMGNVNFGIRWPNSEELRKQAQPKGLFLAIRQTLSEHLKVALFIAFCSIAGAGMGFVIGVKLNPFLLKLYIGLMVLSLGLLVLLRSPILSRPSWSRITGISLIAAFNKTLSGGGYGPLVTGGQILAGVDGKNAVAITSLAEGLTCIVGFLGYSWARGFHPTWLLPCICTGSLLSVPFSALTVRKIQSVRLKKTVGLAACILGSLTLLQLLF